MLDAFNNGANDVANAWATSVSSRSISYRMAMVCALVFELLGALTVGARTADTIKNGIIPPTAFQNNAGVQMLAFTCALAGASTWVMWCTRHSAHVSSTYSLISAVAGVGVATAGARNVQWGWNGGKGLGAIFSGLAIAPLVSGGFAALIFLLVKLVVHMRKKPVPWAVYTSPFFFLIAGTVSSLSIVYKGSPNLHLDQKPAWYIASVTLGVGCGLFALSAIFFVPWLHAKVIKKDYTVRYWHVLMGPALWYRQAPDDATDAKVPDYAVVQHNTSHGEVQTTSTSSTEDITPAEKAAVHSEVLVKSRTHAEAMAESRERLHAQMRQGRGPLGWAMRTLHNNQMGPGRIYELHNLKIALIRLPAMMVVGLLYGVHYDVHAAQTGVEGTPEGKRMARVYGHATKYPNEVEHTYSFVQIITACTASFAHGANDIGNAVAPWAVIYSAWSTGDAARSKANVPLWQIAVLALVLVFGFCTYGYNIMRVMVSSCRVGFTGSQPKANITPQGKQNYLPFSFSRIVHGNGCRYHGSRLLPVQAAGVDFHVHHWCDCRRRALQRDIQGGQLAACWPALFLLGHDHSHCWNACWRHHGHCVECAALPVDGSRCRDCRCSFFQNQVTFHY